jgi:hypothetical protein
MVMVAILALAPPAGAGSIGTVIEGPTASALAIAVSQAYFPAGSASGVVVADPSKPAIAAMAAAFAGGGSTGRVPLLFTGRGVSDTVLRTEIARATGGAAAPGPPTVWLAGTTLGGLDGYVVRSLGTSAAEVAQAVIAGGAAAGTANRVLVFDGGDWRAGAVAAGFGAAYGIPVLPADALPDGFGTPEPVAIVIGSASVPADRFARVDRIEGGDPTALSVAAADALVAKEFPAGNPIAVPVPLRPVSADGYGDDPGPALLASVAAAALQAEGARPPVLLVDGRPGTDLAQGCAGKGKDAAALCVLAKSDGAITVLALTAVGRADGAAAGARLPATGGAGIPPVAVVLVIGVLLVRRRTETAQ